MEFLNEIIDRIDYIICKIINDEIFNDTKTYDASFSYEMIAYSGLNQSDSYLEFKETLNFKTDVEPAKLVIKLSGAFTILRRENNHFLEAGYLSHKESRYFFKLIDEILSRIKDVAEILELSQEKNRIEIEQVSNLMRKINDIFIKTIELSIEGYSRRGKRQRNEAESIEEEIHSSFYYKLIKRIGGSTKKLTEMNERITETYNAAFLSDDRRMFLERFLKEEIY